MKTAAPGAFCLLVLFCTVIILALPSNRDFIYCQHCFCLSPEIFPIYLFLSPLNGLEGDQRRCSRRDRRWSSLLLFSNASPSQCSIVGRKSSSQQKELLCGIQLLHEGNLQLLSELLGTNRETRWLCFHKCRIFRSIFGPRMSLAWCRAMRTSDKLRNFWKS